MRTNYFPCPFDSENDILQRLLHSAFALGLAQQRAEMREYRRCYLIGATQEERVSGCLDWMREEGVQS